MGIIKTLMHFVFQHLHSMNVPVPFSVIYDNYVFIIIAVELNNPQGNSCACWSPKDVK